jgi:predicted Zn finger-like uncharacterized protein
MIVQCPNCQSKSRVDDAGAARGARVRCASCSHVFLPNTAVVSVKPAAPSTAADPAATAEEEFGGKTSLFTGVLPRELVGLGAVTAPPAAASAAPPPQTSSAAPAQPAPAPQRKPAPAAAPDADADEGFGANRTQAIDVSQLAAFSAKLSAAPEPKAAVPGGPVPNAARPVAKPKPALGAISAAPVKLAAVLEQETTADVLGTAVIGTHEPGLLSAGVTTASRVIGGLSAALGVCGLIFFAAGNAIYAQLGLMGGSTIDISEAQSPDAQVEQVTSALYRLADGHEALVALGTVANPSDAQAARMEVQFSLTDSQAHVVGQARGPLGAVLSLEELATITLPDSAAAELRRQRGRVVQGRQGMGA